MKGTRIANAIGESDFNKLRKTWNSNSCPYWPRLDPQHIGWFSRLTDRSGFRLTLCRTREGCRAHSLALLVDCQTKRDKEINKYGRILLNDWA